jgi:hypothetical protein
MLRIRSKLALTLVLLLLAAIAGIAQKPKDPPPDYFPLRVGDSWKYKTTTADGKLGEFTMKVLSTEKEADASLYLLEIMSTQPVHVWYSKPSGWVLEHRHAYPSSNMKGVFEPVKQYLKNPLKAGDAWQWKGKPPMLTTENDESNQVTGPELIEVPAGKFQAMKVVTKLVQGGTPVTKTYWYANWVGLVKSITEMETPGGGFKSTAELVDYSFKKK